MGLFQCSKCGCVDNTALSTGYHPLVMLSLSKNDARDAEVIANIRSTMNLAPDAQLGVYCSVCTPIWYDRGRYGKGPNPHPIAGEGLWHDQFQRQFLPHGMFEDGPDGVHRKGRSQLKADGFYRATEWPRVIEIAGEMEHLHEVGDTNCGEGWCGHRYPIAHTGCGGLIHANFDDETYDGYSLHTRCDKCGEAVDE